MFYLNWWLQKKKKKTIPIIYFIVWKCFYLYVFNSEINNLLSFFFNNNKIVLTCIERITNQYQIIWDSINLAKEENLEKHIVFTNSICQSIYRCSPWNFFSNWFFSARYHSCSNTGVTSSTPFSSQEPGSFSCTLL